MPPRGTHRFLEAARGYLDRQLNVIPVRPRSKIPAIDWKAYISHRATPEEVVHWFASGANNIGILAGEVSDGLVVIDFDHMDVYDKWIADNMERWLYPSVQTAKGRHVYVRIQGLLPSNHHHRELKVDIRSTGGYVLAPPSIHPSGHEYTWCMGGPDKIPILDDWDRLGLPMFESPPRPTPIKAVLNGGVPYRVIPFMKWGAEQGNRDNRAFWAACVCAEEGVPIHEAVRIIQTGLSNSHPDKDPMDWAIEKVNSAYRFKGQIT